MTTEREGEKKHKTHTAQIWIVVEVRRWIEWKRKYFWLESVPFCGDNIDITRVKFRRNMNWIWNMLTVNGFAGNGTCRFHSATIFTFVFMNMLTFHWKLRIHSFSATVTFVSSTTHVRHFFLSPHSRHSWCSDSHMPPLTCLYSLIMELFSVWAYPCSTGWWVSKYIRTTEKKRLTKTDWLCFCVSWHFELNRRTTRSGSVSEMFVLHMYRSTSFRNDVNVCLRYKCLFNDMIQTVMDVVFIENAR